MEREGPREVERRPQRTHGEVGPLQDESPRRVGHRHDQRHPGCDPDLVADLHVLPFGTDPVRAVNVAAEEVLDPVVDGARGMSRRC
jgi:hypothetical protein